ncbi:hypothetical protein BN2476_380037 [Paraburkholderia piptadeniae]|uniref:Uncharacterized protein n=1 Tax=Paraburkholderia piptadeniae TaxID=1701573 RepID=A0A1N7S9Q1_9BURK|nr:hypothetical protein BN2476_380037 [Paraburkholderia piptadeniae]
MPILASYVQENRTIRADVTSRQMSRETLRVNVSDDTPETLVQVRFIWRGSNVHVYGRSVRESANHWRT